MTEELPRVEDIADLVRTIPTIEIITRLKDDTDTNGVRYIEDRKREIQKCNWLDKLGYQPGTIVTDAIMARFLASRKTVDIAVLEGPPFVDITGLRSYNGCISRDNLPGEPYESHLVHPGQKRKTTRNHGFIGYVENPDHSLKDFEKKRTWLANPDPFQEFFIKGTIVEREKYSTFKHLMMHVDDSLKSADEKINFPSGGGGAPFSVCFCPMMDYALRYFFLYSGEDFKKHVTTVYVTSLTGSEEARKAEEEAARPFAESVSDSGDEGSVPYEVVVENVVRPEVSVKPQVVIDYHAPREPPQVTGDIETPEPIIIKKTPILPYVVTAVSLAALAAVVLWPSEKVHDTGVKEPAPIVSIDAPVTSPSNPFGMSSPPLEEKVGEGGVKYVVLTSDAPLKPVLDDVLVDNNGRYISFNGGMLRDTGIGELTIRASNGNFLLETGFYDNAGNYNIGIVQVSDANPRKAGNPGSTVYKNSTFSNALMLTDWYKMPKSDEEKTVIHAKIAGVLDATFPEQSYTPNNLDIKGDNLDVYVKERKPGMTNVDNDNRIIIKKNDVVVLPLQDLAAGQYEVK